VTDDPWMAEFVRMAQSGSQGREGSLVERKSMDWPTAVVCVVFMATVASVVWAIAWAVH
jgi:hypothetical protein